MTRLKCYSELIEIPKYEDRFEYLKLSGVIGQRTFGSDRYLNQILYHDDSWKQFKRRMHDRDNYCDLAHPDYPLKTRLLLHHIEPITKDDILNRHPKIFDPENVITVAFMTHEAIHYGSADLLPKGPIERKPNDTCPWR